MAATGIRPPPNIVADGKLHRFATNGKASDLAGFYVLHADEIPTGHFGCWRSGLSQDWRANIERELSAEERRAHRIRVAQMRAEREAAQERERAEARNKAAEIWRDAEPLRNGHPYLTRKGVKQRGFRLHDGRLAIAVRDTAGELHSLQLIAEDGEKRFLPGGAVHGHYCSIGTPDGEIYIVEGVATGLSVHEASGQAVAVAFNAGNLEPVAKALRTKFSTLRLILCADDDAETEGNPGLAKAREAAKAVNGYLAVPDFGGSRPAGASDFNDLHQLNGIERVRHSLAKAVSVGNGAAREPAPAASTARCGVTTIYRRMSEVKPEPINWLWGGRIARGKLSIIAGDPGLGKSQIAASMAAIITTGGQWPVDRTRAATGNVIILSAEDDAADTIRPRLDAAGAEVARIYILDAIPEVTEEGVIRRAFSLKTDLSNLEGMVDAIGGAALVVIDPISAYLGNADSHKNAEVRALLAPLSELAARLSIAVVGVSHLNKGGAGGALMRVTGSLAFVAAARATYLVSKDPDNQRRRLFLPAKNNIGPDQTGLAFTVEGHLLDGGIETSRIMWEPDPVAMTADEAMSQEDPEERSALQEAKEFLMEQLGTGPVAATALKKAAAATDHAWATVRRAKTALGVEVKREGFGKDSISLWKLPYMLKEHIDAHTNNVSKYEHDEHLWRDSALEPGSDALMQEAGYG